MDLPRRDLILAGGGLLLGFTLPGLRPRRARAASPDSAAPSPAAFIRIAPTGAITLIMPDTEFGQGIWTTAAMLIAEELDVGLSQITLQPAPPDAPLYASPVIGEQATGGSTSTIADWTRLREAGARARLMLLRAAAQKWAVPESECQTQSGTVRHAASQRSAPYGELAAEAAKLPIPSQINLKPHGTWRLIGTPQKRLDTPAKVTGAAQFGIDVKIPGMKIGTVSACPVRGGRLTTINEAAARAVPGVRDIVRLENAVAIIGDHYWAAHQGLRAANPQWDPGPNTAINTATIQADLATASTRPGAIARDDNHAHAKIDASAKKVEATYQLPFLAHAPMEPINTTLHVTKDGADLWVGTQVPVRAQAALAQAAGLRPDQVRVHNQLMGGAFGRRLDVDSIEQAGQIARHLAYPVKLIWSREEDITQDMFRPAYHDTLQAGLDEHGNLTGWAHKTCGSSVTARYDPTDMKGDLDPDAVEGAKDTPYDLPAVHVSYVRQEPTGVATAWWRGVGPTHNVFVVESFLDECAAAANRDPVQFRRSMLQRNPRALAVLNLAAEKAGWGSPLPAGHGRGVSLQYAFSSFVCVVLHAQVTPQGQIKLHRAVAAIDCGERVNPDTIASQVEGGLIFGLGTALHSTITIAGGQVQQSNFNNYKMIRIHEAPKIEVHQIDSRENPGGVGETGTAASAAALGNAIYAATGRRLRQLPFAQALQTT